MNIFIFALFGALACFGSMQATARPVSYPGGWTSMITNNGDTNNVHIHYSPTARYSVGVRGTYNRGADYWLSALQLNTLVKRWNKPDSQANLYLKSGAGLAYSDADAFDAKTSGAFFTGLAADWEDRRFFTSYENNYTDAGSIDERFTQSARVGVAPYIGNYGDVHTWLMLQVDHDPEADEAVTVTPLVRLFKDVHLVETGISNQGDVLFNWVIRY